MKTALKGNLAEKPEIKTVSINGQDRSVIDTAIYIVDATTIGEGKESQSIPFRITAWGERAEKIASMEKGETLTVATEFKANVFTSEDGTVVKQARWNVSKIDETNELASQQTKLITAFSKGTIEKLPEPTEPDKQPDLQEKSATVEPGKEIGKAEEKTME